ncbi:MAG: PEP-CTERM sorting domain-containing protein [Cyanobacteriota bacterium]|nr:PEP-CTERM sorting domain-containing protein [Cyanobacteriota bacterium]
MSFHLNATGVVSTIIVGASLGLNIPQATAGTLDFSITYETTFNFVPLEIAFPDVIPPQSVNIAPLLEDLPSDFQSRLPEDFPTEIENPSFIFISGGGVSEESDPAFGLTNLTSSGFSLGITLESFVDPQTGESFPISQLLITRADPQDLNLDLPSPEFTDTYFGDETDDVLLAFSDTFAIFDIFSPTEGIADNRGQLSIVGGEGIFAGASGEGSFTEANTFDPSNMGGTLIGEVTIDFSVNTPQSVPEPATNTVLIGLGILAAGMVRHRL